MSSSTGAGGVSGPDRDVVALTERGDAIPVGLQVVRGTSTAASRHASGQARDPALHGPNLRIHLDRHPSGGLEGGLVDRVTDYPGGT